MNSSGHNSYHYEKKPRHAMPRDTKYYWSNLVDYTNMTYK